MSLELMSLVMKADLGTVAYLIPATDKRPETTGYLGTFDKHLLMVLADRGNPDGRSIYPSVEWMAKAMGATERAVRISLLRLKGTFPRLLVVERDHVSRYDTLHYMISVTALERVEQWKLRRKEQAGVNDVQPSGVNDVHPSRGLRGERSSSRAERHSLSTERHSLSTELSSAEPSVEPSVDQRQHPAPRNGAAKSAQAFQVGGLLPEEVAALEAPLEVPTSSSAARPAGPTPGSAAAPARRGQQAVATFCEAWKVKYGHSYDILGKDAKALSRIFKKHGFEEYGVRLARYLMNADPFLVKLKHPATQFESRWNALGGEQSPLSGFSRAGQKTMEAGRAWLEQTSVGAGS